MLSFTLVFISFRVSLSLPLSTNFSPRRYDASQVGLRYQKRGVDQLAVCHGGDEGTLILKDRFYTHPKYHTMLPAQYQTSDR